MVKRLLAPSCVLILAILTFAIGYRILCGIHGQGIEPGTPDFVDCLYFSVVTITSLGYGDLHPLGASRILAAMEVLSGLVFIGVFVSRIVSFKHDQMIEYVVAARVVQTFDECLEIIRDSKEELADQSRTVQMTSKIEAGQFALHKSNPFYSPKRALEILIGYIQHTIAAGQILTVGDRFDRSAHHIEELAGVAKRFIHRMDAIDRSWRTQPSLFFLGTICDRVEEFQEEFVGLTKYRDKSYKGPSDYSKVLKDHVVEIRAKIAEGPLS